MLALIFEFSISEGKNAYFYDIVGNSNKERLVHGLFIGQIIGTIKHANNFVKPNLKVK